MHCSQDVRGSPIGIIPAGAQLMKWYEKVGVNILAMKTARCYHTCDQECYPVISIWSAGSLSSLTLTLQLITGASAGPGRRINCAGPQTGPLAGMRGELLQRQDHPDVSGRPLLAGDLCCGPSEILRRMTLGEQLMLLHAARFHLRQSSTTCRTPSWVKYLLG